MSQPVVIISCGTMSGHDMASEGQYLRRFDPDAEGGRGLVEWTPDLAKAIHFADMAEAFRAWKTQSEVQPLRDDGKPNRPLTAYTVRLERAP